MKTVPTNCPRCNSVQKFAVQHRDTDHEWQEAFIKCSKCRWEKILYPTTQEIERARRTVFKLSEKAQHQIDTDGAMAGSISQALRAARKLRDGLTFSLYDKVKEAHDGNFPYG